MQQSFHFVMKNALLDFCPFELNFQSSITRADSDSHHITTRLVTSPPALGDDLSHVVNLSLRTAEGTKLLMLLVKSSIAAGQPHGTARLSRVGGIVKTYSALGELSGALVLAVAQQFDDAALVWGKTRDLTNDVADEGGALAEVTLHAGHARRWLARSDFL